MIDDPPLGLCPEHPDKNAWRSCTRCGRFLCALCTHPTRDGSFCEACLKTLPPVAPRLGGWLWPPLLGLLLNPLMATFSVYQNRDVSFEGATAGSTAFWLWDLAPSVAFGLLSLVILPLFVMRKRVVPGLMMGFYSAVLVTSLIDFVVQKLVPADWHDGSDQPLLRTVAPVVWLLYFRFSERVKRTFVRS